MKRTGTTLFLPALVGLFLLFLASSDCPAGPVSGIETGDITIDLEEVAGGLVSPITLTEAGGRLFVADQVGVIRVIENGALLEQPFLDLRSKVVALNAGFDERGLIGLAFHPNYTENGRFFVRYSVSRVGQTDESCVTSEFGCHKEVLAEYAVSADPNLADAESEMILFEVNKPEFNHNAGTVAFGPDGFLYISLGDGGGRDDGLSSDPPAHGPIGNGQNLEAHLGKLLRIDVDGGSPFAVPADNPFVGRDGLDEIYAYGLRNPYKFSFDRGGSNELFLADVGQDLFEEVDVIVSGGNYGWVLREGAHCFDPGNPTMPPADCPTEGLIDPIAEYGHADGVAVVGGFVHRADPASVLHGKYIFGDFSRDFGPTGRLFYLDADGDRSRIFEFRLGEANEPLGKFLKGFGEDAAGEVYALVSGALGPAGDTGQVFRIVSRQTLFLRGDCNGDGEVRGVVTDAVFLLNFNFLGGPSPGCLAACDADGDGEVRGLVTDAVFLLNFNFLGGPPPPAPFPDCGPAAASEAATGCESPPASCP